MLFIPSVVGGQLSFLQVLVTVAQSKHNTVKMLLEKMRNCF